MLDLADLFFQMAINGQNVQPAIEIIIEKEEPEFQQQAACRADALCDCFISKYQRRALRNIKRGHFCRKISHRDSQRLVISIVGCINSHCAPRSAIADEAITE